MTVLEEAARYAKSIRFADMNEEELSRVRASLVDYIGVAIAASREDEIKPLHEYIRAEGAAPVCGVLGTDIRTSMRLAAFANGTQGHLLDYDDNGPLVGHPATIISPPLLAAASTVKCTGEDLLTAYFAGFQIANCLIKPIERKMWFRCWHLTPVAGIFGGVTAAALILGLTEEELVMAYGITVSQCSSIQSNYGTPTKALGVGFAAAKAIDAVLLAKGGWKSSPAAYEGDGYMRAYSGEEFSEELRPVFNAECGIPERRPQIKPYPACGGAHNIMECAMKLGKKYDLDYDQIESIYVGVDPGGPKMLQCHDPKEPTGARFSAEYCSAGMLVHQDGSMKGFSQEAIDDPRVRKLLPKVTLCVDKELEPYGPAWHPAIVKVTMKDGTVYKEFNRYPKGTPQNPLTREEFNEKFISCVEPTFGAKAEELIKELEKFEEITDAGSVIEKLVV